MCRPPRQVAVAVALRAVVGWLKAVDIFGCDRSNRSGLGCFVPLALRAAT
jgi:hypothetical protein